MAKHNFTLAEKWAVYSVLGPKCNWSKEPVSFDDCEIDHIIPEYIEKDPKEVKKWKSHYGLHDDYSINSFYNWIPIKPKRNKTKSKKTFNGSPFVGELLHAIAKKVQRIQNVHNEWLEEFKKQKVVAFIRKATAEGHDIESILKQELQVSKPDSTAKEVLSKVASTIYGSPLDQGWEIVKKSGAIIDVTKDGKYGFMLDLRYEEPNLEFVCYYCYNWGPWNGTRCLNCGQISMPD